METQSHYASPTWAALLAGLCLVGCEGLDGAPSPPDGGRDVPVIDVTPNVDVVDVAALRDIMQDAPPESGSDVGVDVAADTGPDVGIDVATDAGPDVTDGGEADVVEAGAADVHDGAADVRDSGGAACRVAREVLLPGVQLRNALVDTPWSAQYDVQASLDRRSYALAVSDVSGRTLHRFDVDGERLGGPVRLVPSDRGHTFFQAGEGGFFVRREREGAEAWLRTSYELLDGGDEQCVFETYWALTMQWSYFAPRGGRCRGHFIFNEFSQVGDITTSVRRVALGSIAAAGTSQPLVATYLTAEERVDLSTSRRTGSARWFDGTPAGCFAPSATGIYQLTDGTVVALMTPRCQTADCASCDRDPLAPPHDHFQHHLLVFSTERGLSRLRVCEDPRGGCTGWDFTPGRAGEVIATARWGVDSGQHVIVMGQTGARILRLEGWPHGGFQLGLVHRPAGFVGITDRDAIQLYDFDFIPIAGTELRLPTPLVAVAVADDQHLLAVSQRVGPLPDGSIGDRTELYFVACR